MTCMLEIFLKISLIALYACYVMESSKTHLSATHVKIWFVKRVCHLIQFRKINLHATKNVVDLLFRNLCTKQKSKFTITYFSAVKMMNARKKFLWNSTENTCWKTAKFKHTRRWKFQTHRTKKKIFLITWDQRFGSFPSSVVT